MTLLHPEPAEGLELVWMLIGAVWTHLDTPVLKSFIYFCLPSTSGRLTTVPCVVNLIMLCSVVKGT